MNGFQKYGGDSCLADQIQVNMQISCGLYGVRLETRALNVRIR